MAPANYQSQVVETLRAAVNSMPEPTGHNGPRYMGPQSLNEASIRQMLQSFKTLGSEQSDLRRGQFQAFVDLILRRSNLKKVMFGLRNGQLLPMKDAYKLAIDAFDILVKEKTLGRINVPVGKKVTVVGDLHGQLFDFDHMLSLAGALESFARPERSTAVRLPFCRQSVPLQRRLRGSWALECGGDVHHPGL